jgi:hypothetical protein
MIKWLQHLFLAGYSLIDYPVPSIFRMFLAWQFWANASLYTFIMLAIGFILKRR